MENYKYQLIGGSLGEQFGALTLVVGGVVEWSVEGMQHRHGWIYPTRNPGHLPREGPSMKGGEKVNSGFWFLSTQKA